uniref:Uncharacterized protein n=1 Tax=Rhizophora mucronata TaxID=61149 RepID=A0A2P2PBQ3_RHIMU
MTFLSIMLYSSNFFSYVKYFTVLYIFCSHM